METLCTTTFWENKWYFMTSDLGHISVSRCRYHGNVCDICFVDCGDFFDNIPVQLNCIYDIYRHLGRPVDAEMFEVTCLGFYFTDTLSDYFPYIFQVFSSLCTHCIRCFSLQSVFSVSPVRNYGICWFSRCMK